MFPFSPYKGATSRLFAVPLQADSNFLVVLDIQAPLPSVHDLSQAGQPDVTFTLLNPLESQLG